jgi:hypothetical protein
LDAFPFWLDFGDDLFGVARLERLRDAFDQQIEVFHIAPIKASVRLGSRMALKFPCRPNKSTRTFSTIVRELRR